MSHQDVATAPAVFRPAEEGLPSDDPFTAVSYHFGMLLGVDDFETERSYHRGRECLHQAWLHGPGVVWGLGVSLDFVHHEVHVARGLALDGAGRNLHLDADACLDPAAWFAAHESEVTNTAPAAGEVIFEAHVTASFATCLTRPVPALAEPCAGAQVETAYSRVWETIDLQLVPGPPPGPLDHYRRVRILLGLLTPATDPASGTKASDKAAADARADVLATPAGTRAEAAMAAFRAMANADATDLAPPGGDGPRVLTPGDPSLPVVLAHITDMTLERDGDALRLASGTVDMLARRSHVATATIQELAVAAMLAVPNAAPVVPEPTPVPEPDLPPAPEPEQEPEAVLGVKVDGNLLVVALGVRLDRRSVNPAAVAVSTLTDDGWTEVKLKDKPTFTVDPSELTLALEQDLTAPWLLVVRGTGPFPLLDEKLRPFGGGEDFVHIEKESNQ